MTRMKTFLFAAICFLAVGTPRPVALAVDVPEGIESNLATGNFGDNEYVGLKKVVVESWWNSEDDGERNIVEVLLDYRNPDHEDEPPEKVSIVFGVWDSKKKTLVSKAMGGSVKSSGPFEFTWDMRDEHGEKVPDGIYRVVMNITGEHYGDLLKDAGFPLYITSGGPTLTDEGISARQCVLEYGGAPEIRFTTANINTIVAVDYDDEDNELKRWESVFGAGNHTLKSDLKDKNSQALKPGKYAAKITVSNPFGPEKEFIVRYTLKEPEPLELSVAMGVKGEALVDEKTTIPYTVALNQNAMVTLQHLSEGGAKHYIGKSTPNAPEFLLAKGTHKTDWNRRPEPGSSSHYAKGTHWIRVTATSLTGEKKVVDSGKVSLKAKPQTPKRAPAITLELTPDYVVIGGRMQTTINYSLDMDANVRIALYDSSSGKLLKDIIYRQMKKGRYSTDLGVGNLDEGNYKIVMRAQNNYGKREASKILSLGWRR